MSKMTRFAKSTAVAAGLAIAAATSAPALADGHGAAEAAAMLPTQNIVENASNSPVHTTLVAAVVQAGLVDTLSSPGPFTVFAPTDEAFGMLPAGTVDALMQDGARAQLAQILTYHVVAGSVDAATLVGMIQEAGGEVTITGDANGSVTLIALDNNSLRLEVDVDGDGATDVTIDTTWTEVMAQAEAA